MRKFVGLALMSGLLVVCAVAPAAGSTITWALENVSFGACYTDSGSCTAGGTVAGHFDFDADTKAITNWSISVSGGDVALFAPFTYDPGTSTAAVMDQAPWSEYFVFGASADREFRLAFVSSLTNSGGTIAIDTLHPFVAECYDCSPYRLLAGGNVTTQTSLPGQTPVPEPSTWLLLGTGLAAVAARRRFTKHT